MHMVFESNAKILHRDSSLVADSWFGLIKSQKQD